MMRFLKSSKYSSQNLHKTQTLVVYWSGCFVLSVLPFFGKFGPKNQNCQFELKFGTKTNFNMQNLMVVFSFSVLYQKNPSWANFVQKSKVACSK